MEPEKTLCAMWLWTSEEGYTLFLGLWPRPMVDTDAELSYAQWLASWLKQHEPAQIGQSRSIVRSCLGGYPIALASW